MAAPVEPSMMHVRTDLERGLSDVALSSHKSRDRAGADLDLKVGSGMASASTATTGAADAVGARSRPTFQSLLVEAVDDLAKVAVAASPLRLPSMVAGQSLAATQAHVGMVAGLQPKWPGWQQVPASISQAMHVSHSSQASNGKTSNTVTGSNHDVGHVEAMGQEAQTAFADLPQQSHHDETVNVATSSTTTDIGESGRKVSDESGLSSVQAAGTTSSDNPFDSGSGNSFNPASDASPNKADGSSFNRTRDVRSGASGSYGISGSFASTEPRTVAEAAQQLESFLWMSMLRASGIGKDGGFFPKGSGGDIYRDWFFEVMASAVSERVSLGLGQMLDQRGLGEGG